LANHSKKETYSPDNGPERGISKVVGLGLISAASAIAGGLAVAWWYRKTLTKLQNPIASSNFPRSESSQTDGEGPIPVESDSQRERDD